MSTPEEQVTMSGAIAMLMRTFALVASDPGLGYRGVAISKALEIAALLVEQGGEAADDLRKLHDQIADMVSEGRNPGKAEWLALLERSNAAHAELSKYLPQKEASDDAQS